MNINDNQLIKEKLLNEILNQVYLPYFIDKKLKFKRYILENDLNLLQNELKEMFHEDKGLPEIVSQFSDKGHSLYHFPNIIKRKIIRLGNEYNHKFMQCTDEYSVINCFNQLTNDIFENVLPGCQEFRRYPTLKQQLEKRISH